MRKKLLCPFIIVLPLFQFVNTKKRELMYFYISSLYLFSGATSQNRRVYYYNTTPNKQSQ